MENQPSVCLDSLILTYVLGLSGYKKNPLRLIFSISNPPL